MQFFDGWRIEPRPADFLDVAVIAVFLYVLFAWMRRRSAWALLFALVPAVVLYAVALYLDMFLTVSMFQVGATALLFALVLVFQEDVRRAFESLASWRITRSDDNVESFAAIDALADCTAMLAKDRIGALIVIEGREGLARHIRGGVPIAGAISMPLLLSIFEPHSPGHDGAILIEQGRRVSRFGVHLPLSRNLGQVGRSGTRHAAALGLAECSDALVVVVSEERGTISVAQGQAIEEVESAAELKARLETYYQGLFRRPSAKTIWKQIRQKPLLKLAAVVVACCLWLAFANRVDTVQRSYDVGVAYRNLPTDLKIETFKQENVRVTLSGPERIFSRLDPQTLLIAMDLGGAREGDQEVFLTDDNVRAPPGLGVVSIEPPSVSFSGYRTVTVDLPVEIAAVNQLSGKLELAGTSTDPAVVRVKLRRSDAADVTTIETEPVDMSRVDGNTTVMLNLVLPKDTSLIAPAKATVRATISVRPKPEPEPEPEPKPDSKPEINPATKTPAEDKSQEDKGDADQSSA